MLDNEVPQEGNVTLGGHRKALYARGADGKLHIVQSAGWEVEEIVTLQAVADLNRLAEEARQRVAAGLTSPLEYHMHKVRMDVPLLSQVSGIWQWRIRRHFRPAVFAGLSDRLLGRYGEAMGLSLEQLKKID
ncbi:hypothetical protein GBK02_10475 [Dechloromonas sp. TW-R-39-2]|uniref:hypothetical protein n=1 Tax=Dechloromonas sp. TW-R-39-2 TaxID=2654218 RepID=UPI00193DD23D|nr:hypothetical protein [Dechloromonas sp. TW-R-39-2]QRM19796.1 hypothetical protein GBK02_10475 [Dechloromonas sp. TW-R-39-2]